MSSASNRGKRRVVVIDRLWVCHACQYIGSRAEAEAHRIARGHDVEELDGQTTDEIFAEWHQASDPR